MILNLRQSFATWQSRLSRTILCWRGQHEWFHMMHIPGLEEGGRKCVHCSARQELFDGEWRYVSK